MEPKLKLGFYVLIILLDRILLNFVSLLKPWEMTLTKISHCGQPSLFFWFILGKSKLDFLYHDYNTLYIY